MRSSAKPATTCSVSSSEPSSSTTSSRSSNVWPSTERMARGSTSASFHVPISTDARGLSTRREPSLPASMARVLHVLPHRGGGAEIYIDLLEGGRYEHERIAFSTGREWYLAPPSIAANVPRVARRARGFDVVHVHGDVAATLALPALRSRPSVWSPAGLHFLRRAQGVRGRLARAGVRRVIAATGRVLCQSQPEVDDLMPLAGAEQAGKLVIVDNGVKLPDWPDPKARSAARSELGLPADAVVALFLGQLEPRKDPLTAIRAAEAVDGV